MNDIKYKFLEKDEIDSVIYSNESSINNDIIINKNKDFDKSITSNMNYFTNQNQFNLFELNNTNNLRSTFKSEIITKFEKEELSTI